MLVDLITSIKSVEISFDEKQAADIFSKALAPDEIDAKLKLDVRELKKSLEERKKDQEPPAPTKG